MALAPSPSPQRPAPGFTRETPLAAEPASWPAERCYQLARGFTYRREAFGGILYHYAGVRPDPRVTFVDNPFLIDLLEALEANPRVPLAALCDAVTERFRLAANERARVRDFFATLIARGALAVNEQP